MNWQLKLKKFDITNLMRNNKDLTAGLNQLKEFVNKSLKINAYGLVDLNNLFNRL